MSSTNLNADAGTDQMAGALQQASDRLESIGESNSSLAARFEAENWQGLEALHDSRASLAAVRDTLNGVAEKIGVGGAIVRDAHLANTMVGSKESVVGR